MTCNGIEHHCHSNHDSRIVCLINAERALKHSVISSSSLSSPLMLQWLASLSVLVFSLVVHAVTEPRIVAMGDLHGDLNNTLTIMRFAGLIDQDNRWSGGDTIFVQTVNSYTIHPLFEPWTYKELRAMW